MFNIKDNTEFLTELGINNASEDVKAKLIAGLEDLAKDRLIIKLSERLTDEEAEEFSNITDEQQAHDWLMTKIPDFETLVSDTLSEMKYEILKQKSEVVG